MYPESDLISISALQHYIFCPRQCALIHLEQVWVENAQTAHGRNLHERAHSGLEESRPDCKKTFGMPVCSLEIGLVGQCDCVLEDADGSLTPLEYKRGKPKMKDMDTVQLCAQTLCIEEMTGKKIAEGFIYYFGIKKRQKVALDDKLRDLTLKTVESIRQMFDAGQTPAPVYSKRCDSCSLNEICLPGTLEKKKSAGEYISRMIEIY